MLAGNSLLIVGSRSYGLNISKSDIDCVKLWNGPYKLEFDEASNVNSIFINFAEVTKRLITSDHAHLQWWFPAEFLVDDELTRYIKSERESFVSKRRHYLFNMLFSRAEALWLRSDEIYNWYPKRLAYSTLFYAILARYASGMPFAQAHHMDGELQEQLLAIRRGEVPLKEAQALNRSWREKALAAEPFYDVPEDDLYVHEVETQLRKLVGL